MALQNFQYDVIMREYNRRQAHVQHDLEERRRNAFAKSPAFPRSTRKWLL